MKARPGISMVGSATSPPGWFRFYKSQLLSLASHVVSRILHYELSRHFIIGIHSYLPILRALEPRSKLWKNTIRQGS